MKRKKTIQMCKLILIRSFMYTDNSPWFGFFPFFFEKRTTCRKCMWKEENHHRFSFCCDLWMPAYGCLGMYYMCKCVLVSCKSWFKTHMCGWCLVSNATNSRSTVPTKSRFTVRSQPRSFIHTLQQRSRTHLKSKNEKELFPIIRALDSPFSVHMEAICTHFHPFHPVCVHVYGWLCWCGRVLRLNWFSA